MTNVKVVGTINFDDKALNVYQSLDDPLFRANDIASMIGYSEGNTWKMIQLCEEDETINLPMKIAGQIRLNAKLVQARKDRGASIVDQFNTWNEMLDTF